MRPGTGRIGHVTLVVFGALVSMLLSSSALGQEAQKRPITGTLSDFQGVQTDIHERTEKAKIKALNVLRQLGGNTEKRANQWASLSATQLIERLAVDPPVGPSTIAAPKPGTSIPAPAVNGPQSGATTGHPGVALLLAKQDGSDTFLDRCTGTLIQQNLVLTAAHCVCAFDQGATYPTGSLCTHGNAAMAPSPLLDSDRWLAFFQHVGVRRIKHVEVDDRYQFSDAAVHDDLAILVLSTPISEIIPPLLPPLSDIATNWSNGTAIGYGYSSNQTDPNAPLLVDLVQPGLKAQGSINSASCESQSYLDPAASLCSKYGNGPGFSQATICSGDSGGPLWQVANDQGPDIGITSGRNDANCAQVGTLSFDMAIAYRAHMTWINKIVSQYGVPSTQGQWPVFGDNLRFVVDRRNVQVFDNSGNYQSEGWIKIPERQVVLATLNTPARVTDFQLQDRAGHSLCKGIAGSQRKVPNVDYCWASIPAGTQFRVVAKGDAGQSLQYVVTTHPLGTNFDQIQW